MWDRAPSCGQYPGSIRELAFEGFKDAMADAQITTKDIDASVICSAPEYDKQRSPAGVFAEYLGLNPQPTFYVESLCSSSSTGVRLAYSLVASGLHDVGRRHRISENVRDLLRGIPGKDGPRRRHPVGKPLRHHDAGLLRHVCPRPIWQRYGTTPEDLARIRVKASTYGQINDKAVYRKPVTFDMFTDPENLMASPVASPLAGRRLLRQCRRQFLHHRGQ